jgi:hypothetical protein
MLQVQFVDLNVIYISKVHQCFVHCEASKSVSEGWITLLCKFELPSALSNGPNTELHVNASSSFGDGTSVLSDRHYPAITVLQCVHLISTGTNVAVVGLAPVFLILEVSGSYLGPESNSSNRS